MKTNKLYPIEITEEVEERVKVHYIGYDTKYDEWRSRDEIVQPGSNDSSEKSVPIQLDYRPFDFHKALAYSIKAALKCSMRGRDPDVRIELPFDVLT